MRGRTGPGEMGFRLLHQDLYSEVFIACDPEINPQFVGGTSTAGVILLPS